MIRHGLIAARGSRTQTEVAKDLGISQKYLSKLELGQRTPSANLLAKIADYYKESLDSLFPDIFFTSLTPKRSIIDIYTETLDEKLTKTGTDNN